MKNRSKKYRSMEEATGPLTILPKNDKQKEYLSAIRKFDQVFAVGPAGTGKTWLPSAYAGDLLKDNKISKLIISRPNVPAGKSLGFFPGELGEKMAPWVSPITCTLKERLGASHFDLCVKRGKIEVVPFETMRGRSFENSFILVDEAQNLTEEEMFMLLTRIGEGSKLIVSGDVDQADIKCKLGLSKAIHLISKKDLPVGVVYFTADDIVRSDACMRWVKAWG